MGHDVGDLLLKLVAARLVAAVRQEDTVARLGGDEFVIAMPYVNSVDGVALAAEKIIKALSQPYSIQGTEEGQLTASAGVGSLSAQWQGVKTY